MKNLYSNPNISIKGIIVLLLMLICSFSSFATIRYVKPTATGTGDGLSWTNASGNLQTMIDASNANDQVWVMGGTYKPTAYPTGSTGGISSLYYSFVLKNQTKLYGGFAGTETTLSQRTNASISANPSILSGDIGTPNVKSDNCYHVIISVNDDNSTLLDGFTITEGGNYENTSGRLFVEGKEIDTFGGGAMNILESSPTINNCCFLKNSSYVAGGIYIDKSSSSTLKIINSRFLENQGALFSIISTYSVINCVFANNYGYDNVSSIYEYFSSGSSIINCTFFNNNGNNTIYLNDFAVPGIISTNITNCIFWGNIGSDFSLNASSTNTVQNSMLQLSIDNYPASVVDNGTNIFATDPLFLNATDVDGVDNIFGNSDDGLSLLSCSPAINTGTNTGIQATTDITGAARIQLTTIDIGAYESNSIVSKPSAPSITLPANTTVCSPNTLTLTASCATGTINWSTNSTGTSLTLSNAGTYSISATCNLNGCLSNPSTPALLEIKPKPSAPTITPPANLVVCSPNTLTLTATCATGTLLWSDNSTGTSLTLSSIGTYSITATCGLNGCTSDASTPVLLEINQKPSVPTITPPSNLVVCSPNTLSLTATCTTGTVLWSNNATGTSLTLSNAGTYNISATCNLNGCVSDASSTVSLEIKPKPTEPIITPPANLVVCSPNTLTLTATCATGTLLWSDNSTGTSLTLSSIGTYSITATCNLNGCISDASTPVLLEINQKPSIPAITLPTNLVVCSPNTLTLTASCTTGTVLWSNNATGTSLTLSNAGTYNIFATCNLNGCVSNSSSAVSLEIKPKPNAPTITPPANLVVCSPNTLTLTATCATGTLLWSDNSTGTSLTLSSIGTYSITATCSLNGCVSDASTPVLLEIIEKPSVPTITPPANLIVCSPNTLTLTATCATGTVLWSNNATGTSLTLSSIGTYSISAICNLNACISNSSSTVSLEIKPKPSAPTITPPVNLVVCSPNTLTLTATCATGTVLWSNNSTGTSLTLSSAGSYSISASCNLNGCASDASTTVLLEINQTSSPTITTPFNLIVCSPNNLTLTASCATGTVLWSDNSTGTSLTLSTVGTYSISARCSNNSCLSEVSSPISLEIKLLPAPPTLTLPANLTVCAPNTVALSGSCSTGTILWPDNSSGSSITFTSSISIGFSVACTLNGCYNYGSRIDVNINALPTPQISTNSPICSGKTLSLTATNGGFAANSFVWSGPNSFSSNGGMDISNTTNITNATTAATGVYTVTVTNFAGCTASTSANVVVNASPSPTVSLNPTACVGSTLNLSASGGDFYSWAGPNGFSSTIQNPSIINASTAATGIYTVTLTNTNGCTATANVYATVLALPNSNTSSNSPVCSGNQLILTARGGNSFVWTGPNSFSSTTSQNYINDVSLAAGGTYSVTVTDGNGCVATSSVAVIINPTPTPTINTNAVSSQICFGNTLNLSASGGATYLWSGPNSFSSTLQNPSISNVNDFASGYYSVKATSASGCFANISTGILVISQPVALATSNSPACIGNTLNLSSYYTATSYLWSGPNSFSSTAQKPTISNVTSLAEGIYNLTVSNAIGCTASSSVAVVVKNSIANSKIFVKANASGANNGTSWADAFTDLQSAIEYGCFDTLWVAGGTYLPSKDPSGLLNPADVRDKTFFLPSNKVILGSFAGTETTLSQRTLTTIANNLSILSGDIGTPNVVTDNVYHVVLTAYDNNLAVFDGFTISKGNANGAGRYTLGSVYFLRSYGAGMMAALSSTNISNCTFSNNKSVVAAGLYNHYSQQIINNCTFINNAADSTGGGMLNFYSNPTISNSNFETNSATLFGGGGLANSNSSPIINKCIFKSNTGKQGAGMGNAFGSSPSVRNSLFVQNSASYAGGGLGNDGTGGSSSPTLYNCVFANNTATQLGAGIANNAASPQIINCTFYANGAGFYGGGVFNGAASITTIKNAIFYANTASFGGADNNNNASSATITYSSTQTGIAGTGNLTGQNPLFINATLPKGADGVYFTNDDGFNLQATSPLINVGTNSGVFATDILGNSRINGASADMGAYEYLSVSVTVSIASNTSGAICAGTSVTFTATPTYVVASPIYDFQVNNISVQNSTSPTFTSITLLNNDVVKVILTANALAATSNLITMVVNAVPTPTVSSNSPVCAGSTLNLSASGGVSYTWSGPNSFSSTSQSQILTNTNISLSGTYVAVATFASGCTASTSVSVLVNPIPSAPSISASPNTVNFGENTSLTATGCTGTVQWSVGGFVNNPLVIKFDNTSTFTATCTENRCTSVPSSAANITVNLNPCQNQVTLVSTTDDFSTGNYQKMASSSAGKITATNKLTGSTKMIYKAKAIELNAGFKADSGTVFLAEVGGCN